MSKTRITYEIIAGVLSICTIGGTTAMCVPNSQTKIADYTAENLSPKYAQITALTKEQQEQIKNLEIDIDENGKVIINLQANLDKANQDNEKITNDLNIANGLIKDKDSQIASLQDDKTTLSNEINSLTEQKTQVQSLYEQGLITIEERDATISNLNSQINDKNTLIEQKSSQITILENEKQQLQTQVEELTNQKTQLEQDIATLEQEKATLQAEIEQLRQDKAELQNQINTLNEQLKVLEQTTGASFIGTAHQANFICEEYDYGMGFYFTPRQLSFDEMWTGSANLSVGNSSVAGFWSGTGTDLKSLLNVTFKTFSIHTYDCYEMKFAGSMQMLTCNDFYGETYSVKQVIINLDGQQVDNCDALKDNMFYYANLSNFDTTTGVIIFDITTSISGKYIYDANNYFDFDNLIFMNNGVAKTITGLNVSSTMISSSSFVISVIDINNFDFNGQTYTKQITE